MDHRADSSPSLLRRLGAKLLPHSLTQFLNKRTVTQSAVIRQTLPMHPATDQKRISFLTSDEKSDVRRSLLHYMKQHPAVDSSDTVHAHSRD